ncbi:MAG: hypothetical protein CMH70_06705 [Nitrosomonadaceae bacterium]|nr:hypothetical protein [Nitrosomonadaceae bacterium]|tara:strand:+ start:2198 stop:2593 length:396 start_codon:yes stop_codon:yes gene_type:complete
MKNLLWILVFSVISTHSIAEWNKVDTSNQIGLTAYADSSTIVKSGAKVEMWVLYDYKTAQKSARKPFLSIRGQWRYDCKEIKEQPVYEILLSENMGRGEVIGKTIYDESMKWLSIVPNSVGMAFWKLACRR